MKQAIAFLLLAMAVNQSHASDYTTQPECTDGWTNAASDYVMPLDGAKAYASGDADYMLKDLWAFPEEFPDTPPGFRELMLTVKKQVASIHRKALPAASSRMEGPVVRLPAFFGDMLAEIEKARPRITCPPGQGV